MKKILLFGGIASVGYAFYYYFKKQLSLALNYEYKLKNIQVLSLDADGAKIDVSIEITNKSTFQVDVLEYDMVFNYQGVPFADAKSNIPFTIKPDSKFIVSTVGNINFKEGKTLLLPFAKNIIARKPINIEIDGYIKVNFLNINRTVPFNKQSVEYSKDLLVDVGLDDDYEKGLSKIENILGKFGIKI